MPACEVLSDVSELCYPFKAAEQELKRRRDESHEMVIMSFVEWQEKY